MMRVKACKTSRSRVENRLVLDKARSAPVRYRFKSTDLFSPNTSRHVVGFIEVIANPYTANIVASRGFAVDSAVQAAPKIFS